MSGRDLAATLREFVKCLEYSKLKRRGLISRTAGAATQEYHPAASPNWCGRQSALKAVSN
jgi:hypothetical protein